MVIKHLPCLGQFTKYCGCFIPSSPVKKHISNPLVLFLLAFFCAGTIHLINHNTLARSSPQSLRNQITVRTSDDASYLVPAENYITSGEWKSNAAGNAAITTRSPGYGLIYAVLRMFFTVEQSLIALAVIQLLLFALAVALIPQIAAFLILNSNIGSAVAGGVAVLPLFSGFLSYTLTEAVTPSLVLIFLYGLFRFYREPKSGLFPIALLVGFLILVRPALIVWVFAPCILAVYHFREMRFRKLITLAIVSIFPILIWQVYISVETETIQSLHPIYQDNNNDLYRPLHADIWNFHKSWGQTGYAFNSTVNQLWTDALGDVDPQNSISKILENTDQNVVDLIGEDKLQNAYTSYFEILRNQVPYANQNLLVNGVSDSERELSATFKEFRNTYLQDYWFYSNVVVPAKVYLQLGFHSNLNLFVFQKSWRGNTLMEALRYISFLIHFGIFLCFPLAAIITRKSALCLSVSIPILIYLGYLCIVQRGVEERYTLPVLIPMLVIVAVAAQNILGKLRLKYQNRV